MFRIVFRKVFKRKMLRSGQLPHSVAEQTIDTLHSDGSGSPKTLKFPVTPLSSSHKSKRNHARASNYKSIFALSSHDLLMRNVFLIAEPPTFARTLEYSCAFLLEGHNN